MSLSEHTSQDPDKEDVLNSESETEHLRRDIFRSDKEKFLLFAQMLRTNAMLKRAKITHKK